MQADTAIHMIDWSFHRSLQSSATWFNTYALTTTMLLLDLIMQFIEERGEVI